MEYPSFLVYDYDKAHTLEVSLVGYLTLSYIHYKSKFGPVHIPLKKMHEYICQDLVCFRKYVDTVNHLKSRGMIVRFGKTKSQKIQLHEYVRDVIDGKLNHVNVQNYQKTTSTNLTKHEEYFSDSCTPCINEEMINAPGALIKEEKENDLCTPCINQNVINAPHALIKPTNPTAKRVQDPLNNNTINKRHFSNKVIYTLKEEEARNYGKREKKENVQNMFKTQKQKKEQKEDSEILGKMYFVNMDAPPQNGTEDVCQRWNRVFVPLGRNPVTFYNEEFRIRVRSIVKQIGVSNLYFALRNLEKELHAFEGSGDYWITNIQQFLHPNVLPRFL